MFGRSDVLTKKLFLSVGSRREKSQTKPPENTKMRSFIRSPLFVQCFSQHRSDWTSEMYSNSNNSLADISIKLNSASSVYHPSDVVSGKQLRSFDEKTGKSMLEIFAGAILIDVKKSFDTRGESIKRKIVKLSKCITNMF